jgi:sigma-B regulation protein RsbU (phosphoserine phosphatase)
VLGRAGTLGEAARTILREVSAVVGAHRASIMVYDEHLHALRAVAALGFEPGGLEPVPVSDTASIAARVYRDQCLISHVEPPSRDGYAGHAFLSVPIRYARPGIPPHCVGVISFTDRDGDAFTDDDRRLVTAIANLVGVAVEHARLVERERIGERIRRELQLAADLQLRLLPSPSVLHGDAKVAARCVPAEWVGGDFYTFTRLGRGRVGVMLGDVSSHGFSAALVMALVVSAAGIHAGASVTPDETLTAMLESLAPELARTEMYLTVFYGVVDPVASLLTYANAGHPHAFRLGSGAPERLAATSAPMGLAAAGIARRQVPWARTDLLCLWTDGLVEARSGIGEPFGEARLLAALEARRDLSPDEIVNGVMADVDGFAAGGGDDRTLLVLQL